LRRLWHATTNTTTSTNFPTAANFVSNTATNLVPNTATNTATNTTSNTAADFVSNTATSLGDLFAIGVSDATVHDQSGNLTLQLSIRAFETWIAKKGN